MFELLTGLNNLNIFNVPAKKGVSFKPGQLAVINSSGEAEPADPAGHYAPWYVVFSDANEPAVQAAGTIALMYGDMRIKTDNVVDDTYAPGDPLTIGTNGALKKYDSANDSTPVVGYVEQVVDATNKVLIVRML